MNHLTIETEDYFYSLFDLVENKDFDGFKKSIEPDCSVVVEVGQWYGRKNHSKQMILEDKTPLMVAATYGNVDVLKLILSNSEVNVNFSCGLDKSMALHCAASGGSIDAVEVVRPLMVADADPSLAHANGQCPFDVIVTSPKVLAIEPLLKNCLQPMVLMALLWIEICGYLFPLQTRVHLYSHRGWTMGHTIFSF